MSRVTQIMILGLFEDEEMVIIHNTFKTFIGKGLPFLEVEGHKVGGNKNLECDILIGAFNYIDGEEFCNLIHSLKDKIHESYTYNDIQVVVKCQDDEGWSLYNINSLNEDCFN